MCLSHPVSPSFISSCSRWSVWSDGVLGAHTLSPTQQKFQTTHMMHYDTRKAGCIAAQAQCHSKYALKNT